MAKFKVEGLAELNAKLNFAAVRARAAAMEALHEEVDAIREDAKSGAPVKSGALRDGIQGEVGGTEGKVRTTARHSTFVEHGTYKDPAQPYMAPAAAKSRVRWPLRAGARIRSALGG